MIKRYWIVFVMLVCCVVGLSACAIEGGSNAEITTAKSGKIEVGLYDQNVPADKLSPAIQLTPLVETTDRSITDDGKGLYRILSRTEGEGTLTLSTDKAKEGATITFTATPATDWRFVSVSVNGEIVQNNGTSFVMPSADANVVAVFADMRHAVVVGDHIVADWGELRDDYYMTTAYTLVAGQRYEFTVDYNEDGHYYEDEDVTCRSRDGNEILTTVTKVGDGRYSFVAPDSDCWVTVETHEYRHIDAVKVFTSSYDWGIYDEQDYTDAFTVSITVDGQPYTYGDLVKDGKTAKLTLSSSYGFTVKGISRDSGWSVPFQQRHNSYMFALDFSAQILGVNIEITGETVFGQTYSVDCAQAEHGSVSANKSRAAAESTVSVTVTPDEDYILNTLQYTTDGEHYTDISENNGAYSFVMPDADVTITATFSEAPAQSGLLLSATGDKNSGDYNDYNLADVIIDIYLVVNEQAVSPGEIVNGMILPTGTGHVYVEFYMNETYKLMGIYFKNSNVMIEGDAYWGCAEFDVQEGDTALVLVVKPN